MNKSALLLGVVAGTVGGWGVNYVTNPLANEKTSKLMLVPLAAVQLAAPAFIAIAVYRYAS